MSISTPHFQTEFPREEFSRRRAALIDALGPGVAVVQGSAATGAFDRFRQHNDFFYLCGVETPHAYLVIDARSKITTLYLAPLDARMTEIEGAELNADEAQVALSLTGVEEVRPLTALADDLRNESTIHVCHRPAEGRHACQDTLREASRLGEVDPWRSNIPLEAEFAQILKERLGPIEFHDLSPLLCKLRRLKSDAEIEVLRRAGEITTLATCEALRSTSPGLIESQLAAIAEYVFSINGAQGSGYRPIVASGDNIWNMHYYRNDSRLLAGEMVLFDFAPDYSYYTSDIGRMWPVNGSYSPQQQELYGFVVDYHFTLLELIEPGKTPKQIRQEASTLCSSIASRTKWSSTRFRDSVEKLLATSRAITHSVGMAVHDESGYQDDDQELEPGLVFALDPQLWVQEERLYVRVEDNVVVTESGVENLTAQAPHTPEKIELLMRESGLIQTKPELFLSHPNVEPA